MKWNGKLGVAGHPHPGLTPQQAFAVRCLAVGLGTKHAAYVMGITASTVRGYLEQARRRMGAATNCQLVAELGKGRK